MVGSSAVRTSIIDENGAFSNCSSRLSVAARMLPSGCWTIGPPPGPGLSMITP